MNEDIQNAVCINAEGKPSRRIRHVETNKSEL